MLTVLATFFADPWFDVILGACVACIAYCTVAEIREAARDRAEHIDAMVRYHTAPDADEQRDMATAARWRREDSPANRRSPAPWFGGEQP